MSDDGARAAAQYVGSTIGGRFQLQSLLGAGGMASVYLAYDAVLDRKVAVKTLHSDLGREQSFRERFRREAQSVAKLTHTNIVSVFDSGEDAELSSSSGAGDGSMVPYIVMEYVEGTSLRTVLDEDIAQYGAMPTEKALKITGEVLAALGVSHEMGLVHRDIKPGNVMLTKRGDVKVMDFGIARAMQSGVTSMTQTGMVVGTPQYLSPEQALGRGVDARSDLYSVGILLFELLTGRLPFDADSPLAIAYAHVQEEAPAPSAINQAVPPALDALVARVLRKNPDERFPTADAMHEECRRIGGSGASGVSPSIVGGPPAANSGAGVGQAVFPPVAGQDTPSTVVPPYPQQFGSFGPSTPPPGPGGQLSPQGYLANSPYQQGGPNTPPPVTLPPHGPGGAGAPAPRNTNRTNPGVVIAAVAVSLIAILGVLAVIGSSSKDTPAADSGPTYGAEDSGSTDASDGSDGSDTDDSGGGDDFKPEDKSKTIDDTRCTNATQSYNDKSKVLIPEFTYKNLESVKECISAAGWKAPRVTTEDENIWGKNTVLEQSPEDLEDFDPQTDAIELTVSTGKPE